MEALRMEQGMSEVREVESHFLPGVEEKLLEELPERQETSLSSLVRVVMCNYAPALKIQ